MRSINKMSIAISLVALSMMIGVASVKADSSTPANYVGVNFSPITTTVSSNFDFLTGTLTSGTMTATALSVNGVFLTTMVDPSPPDNRQGATFFGNAGPFHYLGDEVVYEQSTCPTGYPTCFSDGTFTFGGFATRNMQGATLDQLTNLQSNYNVQTGCFGGGSPRFQIDMSNGKNIFVYFGTAPPFSDCPTPGWHSTGQFASDSSGLRWDSSQLGGPFYGSYSIAVTLANLQGLTIDSISIITDGGWFGTNAGNSNGQTFLFQSIQIDSTTRFP